MKQGMTLNGLASEVERQLASKRDWVAPGRRMTMELEVKENDTGYTTTPRMVLANGNGGVKLGITRTAHDQIAGRLGIPAKYYQRMQEEEPGLLSANVNGWLTRGQDKFLVRSLDGSMRAMLSDAYRQLDNFDLLTAVLPVLLGEVGATIESCNVDTDKLYLQVLSPKIQGEVRQGDVVQAGMVISNSEVGRGSLSVQPMVYRLWCTNGLIVADWGMRRAHVGRRQAFGDMDLAEEFYSTETRKADDKAFWLKVRDVVRSYVTADGFSKVLASLQEAAGQPINARKAAEVVEVTAKRFLLGENERQGVLAHLLTGGGVEGAPPDFTRYGLANAITRAAQDADSYERAVDLERLGGQVLELPRKDWEQIALLN